MAKKSGLGKGLGALGLKKDAKKEIKQPAAPAPVELKEGEVVRELALKDIRPNEKQPRKTFDEDSLDELKDSIRQYGVLQPILVKKSDKGYELIAGERRYRAAKLAGLKTIPAIERKFTRQELTEVALIENLQREDLNAIEEAQAYAHLMKEFSMTQEQLSGKIGRSRSHIANFLRLLKLPERVQESLVQEVISMGQAKPLLSLEDNELQQKAANYIIDHELSAREAESLVAKLKKDPSLLDEKGKAQKQKPQSTADVFMADAEEQLRVFFGTKVKIMPGKKRSKIEIEFYSPEDLSRIVETIHEFHGNDVARKTELLRQASRKFIT